MIFIDVECLKSRKITFATLHNQKQLCIFINPKLQVKNILGIESRSILVEVLENGKSMWVF